jgi:hypothetical protein
VCVCVCVCARLRYESPPTTIDGGTFVSHVAEITPEIAITRARYKAPFPVTSREVVAFR